MSDKTFEQAIFDHLALAERNRKLERSMPIDRYRDLYGGGARPVEHDELPGRPDPAELMPDVEWDATAERPLPTFHDGD